MHLRMITTKICKPLTILQILVSNPVTLIAFCDLGGLP